METKEEKRRKYQREYYSQPERKKIARELIAEKRKNIEYRNNEKQAGIRLGTKNRLEEYRKTQAYKNSVKKYRTSIKGKLALRRMVDNRRARIAGVSSERIDYNWINQRDGFKCQLCLKKIDMDLRHPHPMSASYDHILSLKRKGEHNNRNLQLAHLLCNEKKHAKEIVIQQYLF